MPYDEPDPQDPTVLVGHALPAGPDAVKEMACVFADEFARIGYDEAQILAFFTRPFYAGAYGTYRRLGEHEIRRIIAESVNVWGRIRLHDHQPGPSRNARRCEEPNDD